MKFRKKPVVIEAKQWWPPGDERHDPSMLTLRGGNSVNPPDYRQTGDLYPFTTIKGMGVDNIYFIRVGGVNDNVQVHPGDWIITGVKGEKYPCRPDIFEATYEEPSSGNSYESANLLAAVSVALMSDTPVALAAQMLPEGHALRSAAYLDAVQTAQKVIDMRGFLKKASVIMSTLICDKTCVCSRCIAAQDFIDSFPG